MKCTAPQTLPESGKFAEKKIELDTLLLPRLPSLVRYTDIFTEKEIVLRNLEEDYWEISDRGRKALINFSSVEPDLKPLFKILGFELLSAFSPSTALHTINALIGADSKIIRRILLSTPETIKTVWEQIKALRNDINTTWSLKSILKLACNHNIMGWSPLCLDLIACLPCPKQDKWASLRTGDVFLSLEEESRIVHYLDNGNREARQGVHLFETRDLIDLALVTSSYQFGLRPVQIGRLKLSDIVLRTSDADTTTSVYLTCRSAKQRSSQREFPMIRKVKSEWGYAFVELLRRRGSGQGDLLLNLPTANATSQRIAEILSKVTGIQRTATDLRHTAAQRLVDAGASHEELAEFMGHSDLSSGLVYYDISANQNERVNSALGLSETYKTVARIAKSKFISEIELANLKDTQQIGGAPHGIPIAGIGGCEAGQPLCPSNPVAACYGCSKFMPLADINIHNQVLSDFRTIVNFYELSSRAESSSAAFLQLRRTIDDIKNVIAELDKGTIHE